MSILRRALRALADLRRSEIRTVPVPYVVDTSELLKGRVALITGGAGGIGYAIAAKYIAAGATVVVAGRNSASLAAAVNSLGDRASALVLDLHRPEDFDEAIDSLNPLPDILVNCAGLVSMTPFGEVTLEEYDAVMSTNVRSILFLSQSISRRWIATRTPGNILNISSGSQYKPGWTPYQISKNALHALTAGMASFLVKEAIVVNAIAPGPVATPMLGLTEDDITFLDNPTQRAITPDEVAQWCLWLVSDAGRYVVGSTFAITGGNGVFQWERQGP